MTDKEVYEMISAVAERHPEDNREELARLLTTLAHGNLVTRDALRRWKKDAGY
jgi:hypothetical protein